MRTGLCKRLILNIILEKYKDTSFRFSEIAEHEYLKKAFHSWEIDEAWDSLNDKEWIELSDIDIETNNGMLAGFKLAKIPKMTKEYKDEYLLFKCGGMNIEK